MPSSGKNDKTPEVDCRLRSQVRRLTRADVNFREPNNASQDASLPLSMTHCPDLTKGPSLNSTSQRSLTSEGDSPFDSGSPRPTSRDQGTAHSHLHNTATPMSVVLGPQSFPMTHHAHTFGQGHHSGSQKGNMSTSTSQQDDALAFAQPEDSEPTTPSHTSTHADEPPTTSFIPENPPDLEAMARDLRALGQSCTNLQCSLPEVLLNYEDPILGTPVPLAFYLTLRSLNDVRARMCRARTTGLQAHSWLLEGKHYENSNYNTPLRQWQTLFATLEADFERLRLLNEELLVPHRGVHLGREFSQGNNMERCLVLNSFEEVIARLARFALEAED